MMERFDYEAAGLISGLEVHQQLMTEHKLFCRCPAGMYSTTHDGEMLRHMRPTLSELGVYDGTALMEFKTKKEIIYLLNHKNVCTYEMDDTPPFLVNQQAIDIAIELCLTMNMDIIDEVHIARKQYLDGSIPTGFQRTAIVGVNGWLPFKDRRITITHLSVEEDSCREVSDKGHRIVWRTDRLGMPLTETVTGPDLRTPEEVRDAIVLCGLVARNTGRVRTGIGASRQDINVSVRGGSRVEIKGVPRAGYAVKLVHNEAIRQSNLLKLREEMRARGLREASDVKIHSYDVSDIFAQVELGAVRRALQSGGRVVAVRTEGVAGLAQSPTQPHTRFLDELSGRIRVIACLDQPPIVLSEDSMPEFPHRHKVIERVRKRVRQDENDDFFIVFGPEEDCRTAAEEIRIRFADAIEGVPKETRQALFGGYTTFERILPGPDRMYPDTDSPPSRITPERVAAAKARLRPAPWERIARYLSWRVPEETAYYLLRRGGAETVDAVVEKTGVDGLVAAIEIGQRAKALARKGIPVTNLDVTAWTGIFDLLTDGRITREAVPLVAAEMAKNPGLSAEEASVAARVSALPKGEWMAQVEDITLEGCRDSDWGRALSSSSGPPGRSNELASGKIVTPSRGSGATGSPATIKSDPEEKRLRFLAGKAMKMLRGKAPAREVVQYLREKLIREVSQ